MMENTICPLLEQGQTVALVTVIDKSGSAPRLPGSKMIVEENGRLHGTIGGGRMEYCLLQKAKRIAGGDKATLEEVDLQGSGAEDDMEMVCGGIQMVLIEPITPKMLPMFQQAAACYRHNARGVWKIDISEPDNPQRSFIDLEQEHGEEQEKIDLTTIIRRRTSQLIQRGEQKLVFDPLPKSGTVILFGGGHVALEVAHLATYADFAVVVCDDRQEFADRRRFPTAKATHITQNFTGLAPIIKQYDECYLLVLTHGHLHDQDVLAQALTTDARYIGMIGSRRKRDILYDNLRKQGFTDADFSRVHCPVGLSIGSETPQEIAISIVAELVAARAGAL